MPLTERMDALDLLIEMLMNHEKRLDELVARLDLLVDQLDVEGSTPVLDGPSASQSTRNLPINAR